MASPVTPQSICALVPNATASVCQRVKNTLVVLPQKLCDFFTWMLNSAGEFTDAFKLMIAYVSWSPGDTKWSFTAVQPAGWLLCDGSAVDRTLYSALFSNIGTIFGIGDGSTTFNLPDARSRGLISAGQGQSNYLNSGNPLLTSRAAGQAIGEEGHVLTQSELPNITSLTDPVAAGGFGLIRRSIVGEVVTLGASIDNIGSGTQPDLTAAPGPVPNGSDAAHNNIQPSLVAYCYIFTGKLS